MMRAKFILIIVFCLLLQPMTAGHFGAMNQKVLQNHDYFWISQSVFIEPPTGVAEIHDVLCQDINGDGLLDRLYAHSGGLIAEFGDDSPSGWTDPKTLALPSLSGFPTALFPSEKFRRASVREKTPWSMDGELNLDLLPAFWCRWTGPDRVLGLRIEGTRVVVTHEVELSPTQLVEVTAGGLVYGPDSEGKIHLEEYGVRRVLTSNVPPLDWMQWSDVDGDGESDLIVKKRGGGLGVLRMLKGRMHGLEWLDQTTLLDHWFTFREENGRLSIFGQMTGVEDDYKWRLGDDQKWSIQRFEHSGWFDDLTFVRAEEVGNGLTYTIAVSRPWGTTLGAIWRFGKCVARFELEKSDVLGFPHFSDMNADGLLDFVFWDERAEQLVCHYLFNGPVENGNEGSLAELVFLDRTDSIAVEYAEQNFFNQLAHEEQSAIMEGLAGGDVEAFHLRRGVVEVCGHGFCQHMEPTLSLMSSDDIDLSGCSGKFKLGIPSSLSTTEENVNMSLCLQEEEWSHVVYTRDEDFVSNVYINNELAFEGSDRMMDFAFRILSLGAEGGHVPHRYFDGDIDEIEIVGAILDSTEISRRFESRSVLPHPRSISAFDFEYEPNRKYSFGTDEVKLSGGCEVVPGVRGMGLRFDGLSGRASVFMRMPSSGFSISLWVRPHGAASEIKTPRSILSVYGKRNLELEVLPMDRSGVFSRPALKMTNSKVEKPEDGMVFSYDGDHYFLSKSGRLMVQMGFDWRELAVPNALAEMTIQGRPWFVENSLHAIVGRNFTHMVLDLETKEWSQVGRLNALVDPVESAIRATRGTLLIVRDEEREKRSAFWWPIDSDKLYPVQMPSSDQSIVAVMNALGRFVWVLDSGKETHVQVDLSAVPVPLYQSGFPSWAWLAGGVFLLLVGAGTWRGRSANEEDHATSDIKLDDLADEVNLSRMRLPVHSDVLKMLREAGTGDFDVQGLDNAFVIGDIETDETRRSRRARMINELNAWWREKGGNELIQRGVDESDKRRRIYKLDPGFKQWYDENVPLNSQETRQSAPGDLH